MRSPAERSKPPSVCCATSARLCRHPGPCRTPSAWRSLSADIGARLRRLSTPASGSQSGTPELSSRIPSQRLHARPEPALGQRRFWLFPGAGSAMLSVPLPLARGASRSRTRAVRKPKPAELPALAGIWRRLYVHAAPPRTRSPTGGRDRRPQEALQSSCQAPATASDFCAHAWQRPVAAKTSRSSSFVRDPHAPHRGPKLLAFAFQSSHDMISRNLASATVISVAGVRVSHAHLHANHEIR
jgi:hypothetical protein